MDRVWLSSWFFKLESDWLRAYYVTIFLIEGNFCKFNGFKLADRNLLSKAFFFYFLSADKNSLSYLSVAFGLWLSWEFSWSMLRLSFLAILVLYLPLDFFIWFWIWILCSSSFCFYSLHSLYSHKIVAILSLEMKLTLW